MSVKILRSGNLNACFGDIVIVVVLGIITRHTLQNTYINVYALNKEYNKNLPNLHNIISNFELDLVNRWKLYPLERQLTDTSEQYIRGFLVHDFQ